MVEELSIEDIETRLVSGTLTKENMIDLAKQLEPFEGLEPSDVFPIGTVQPDAIRVKYELTAQELSDFSQGISVAALLPIRKLSIFPLGIVVPDRFLLQVDVASRLA